MKGLLFAVLALHVVGCGASAPPGVAVAQTPVDDEVACRSATVSQRRQIWNATTAALASCAPRLRQGIFIEGRIDLHLRADASGRLTMEHFEMAADAGGFRSCLVANLADQRAGHFGVCVETTLRYELESEVDLYDRTAMVSDGERGDWVFRAPPSETPAFDVAQARGLATRSDGRFLGETVFGGGGLEICFADAVYSALADEVAFELDVPLLIHYEPRVGQEALVEIIRSPSPSLSVCVLRLAWPAAHAGEEVQQASIRLRVVSREVLHLRLVEALSR